ncbi:hypothetical protein [Shewanella colwelliana]|uniref:hypothetical protein n=1 Tax=Shewanella colwelliana TaxID=23 RepID=UPI0022AEEC70|nr:hypothetical protein [Shewanella colwelliana]MCZ4337628.1 hypothetical protein [Shewanella colwelliana]
MTFTIEGLTIANSEADQFESSELIYMIDGELVVIDQETKDKLNELSARFVKRLGYSCEPGYDYSKSRNPRTNMVWALAVETYYTHLMSGLFD